MSYSPPNLSLFDPRYSWYLRGFDRRGCTASLNNCSATGCTVSGYFSDVADFVVLMVFDQDDLFGHRDNSRYLPVSDLTGVIVTFDLATTNCFNPTSLKAQSVPWGALSYCEENGTTGTVPLVVTGTSGASTATCTYTIGSSLVPVLGDEIDLIYLGNVIFDVVIGGVINLVTVLTTAQAATALAYLVNQYNYAANGFVPLTATALRFLLPITAPMPVRPMARNSSFIMAANLQSFSPASPMADTRI